VPRPVIPAQAGIQALYRWNFADRTPALAGITNVSDENVWAIENAATMRGSEISSGRNLKIHFTVTMSVSFA
jgi:hypothetical protein